MGVIGYYHEYERRHVTKNKKKRLGIEYEVYMKETDLGYFEERFISDMKRDKKLKKFLKYFVLEADASVSFEAISHTLPFNEKGRKILDLLNYFENWLLENYERDLLRNEKEDPYGDKAYVGIHISIDWNLLSNIEKRLLIAFYLKNQSEYICYFTRFPNEYAEYLSEEHLQYYPGKYYYIHFDREKRLEFRHFPQNYNFYDLLFYIEYINQLIRYLKAYKKENLSLLKHIEKMKTYCDYLDLPLYFDCFFYFTEKHIPEEKFIFYPKSEFIRRLKFYL